jgi:hypothetical protein
MNRYLFPDNQVQIVKIVEAPIRLPVFVQFSIFKKLFHVDYVNGIFVLEIIALAFNKTA